MTMEAPYWLSAETSLGRVVDYIAPLRRMFYTVFPWEMSFRSLADVPDYIQGAVPFFIGSILVEAVILVWLRRQEEREQQEAADTSSSNPKAKPASGRKPTRKYKLVGFDFFDAVTSMSSGLFMLVFNQLVLNGFELRAYAYVFERFRLVTLPSDSLVVWVVGFLGVDLGYYWFHRMAHEINLFWSAGHVVHHSSDAYNATVAVRQSALQLYTSWMFYLPLALVLPPPAFHAHRMLNTLFQFWIHTELIDNIGPLEWILNTPSHHRVHHGRNPYCIDKNYAGTLIIWDRMFGTFEAERRDEEPVSYGLTHVQPTFDPWRVQFEHLARLVARAFRAPSFGDALRTLFYGPGWTFVVDDRGPCPRLGHFEDIPKVDAHSESGKMRHRPPPATGSLNVYCLLGFFLAQGAHSLAGPALGPGGTPTLMVHGAVIAFVLLTLTTVGALYSGHSWAVPLECARLLLSIGYLLLAERDLFSSAIRLSDYRVYLRLAALVQFLLFIWLVTHRNSLYKPASGGPAKAATARATTEEGASAEAASSSASSSVATATGAGGLSKRK
ncbi:hypothetical protein H696_05673 [Fonticula alba]|uniref:Fatty acid hydroxylase domain-containing protein n=1 Tax=Fonticula alba TaxID=691883 RepID=A0A058Z202_FONAL|nr:hypothetical protein H696_05673 [Fonticula alba]KCV67948.1 hypothetical protein H696_05673 [Fonticula alba]|eukprot:XP_009497768.1 hypothetical protein H696_05673 [Fonticula alba]